MRERLDVIAAAPGIDDACDARLLLKIQLRIAGNAGREIGRKCDRFVQRIRMERLRPAEHGSKGLNACADNVVHRILRCKAPTGCLAMRTQGHGFLVLRVPPFYDFCPEYTRRAKLRYLHEVIHANSPEEAKLRSELVYRQPGIDSNAKIFQAVGKGVSEFEVGRSSGLLHVIPADRDAIELRHVRRAVAEYIADNSH
jgi:hypothetical protein